MSKPKYQWSDVGLKQKARVCQWAMLILGLVGIAMLFTNHVPIFIVVIVLLLIVNIYSSSLRKKDRIVKYGGSDYKTR